MPYKWTPESERALLLLAFAEVAPPAATVWNKVAEQLGNGLSGSACSQKFYKLKKESEKLLSEDGTAPGPTTPATSATKKEKHSTSRKRKAEADDATDTPAKKTNRKLCAVEVKTEELNTNGGVAPKVEDSDL
ncbi:hypothetical protein PV08_08957 [Exophiala spinifera]|uniref:Myb-like domain-containing protein n=1 Tax=Exophiala spinifera TaxID=91928 RepID=A0A0D1YF90_9EURO|nr:uncharacterized protein PV08_08957 [Exophiala spinifera]KIW13766.1 hypothetical protein PV08_08957 [Exophiala spinifera]